jgi:hypothetical protein
MGKGFLALQLECHSDKVLNVTSPDFAIVVLIIYTFVDAFQIEKETH